MLATTVVNNGDIAILTSCTTIMILNARPNRFMVSMIGSRLAITSIPAATNTNDTIFITYPTSIVYTIFAGVTGDTIDTE